jgi:hypothetical protein
MEKRMTYREYSEWIILFNLEDTEREKSKTSQRPDEGQSSGPAWQNQLALMRMVSLRQQLAIIRPKEKRKGAKRGRN